MATTKTKTGETRIKKDKKGTFAERTEKRLQEENQWQQYNASAKFLADKMQESLETLAKKTFPTDKINRQAYQEAIAKALVETLSPEIGVKDFWAKMAENGCKELKIEDGHLSFYNNKKEKIDITPYTQAIIFEAHSSFYEQRILEREERIEEAKKQLESLMEEINQKRKHQ